jgi:hypothetical protein
VKSVSTSNAPSSLKPAAVVATASASAAAKKPLTMAEKLKLLTQNALVRQQGKVPNLAFFRILLQ